MRSDDKETNARFRSRLREGGRARERVVAADVETVKMEEDGQSEMDSPSLPLIEISEVEGVGVPALRGNEGEVGAAKRTLEEEAAESESAAVVEPQAAIEDAGSVNEEGNRAAVFSQDASETPQKRSQPHLSGSVHVSPASTVFDESANSETSSQEGPGQSAGSSTRLPREAHKRLKIVGGYYRKPGRHRGAEGIQAVEGLEQKAGSSRGTSYAPDEADEGVATTVNGLLPGSTTLTEAGAQAATTLTGNLRRMTAAPLARPPTSKLMHVSGDMADGDASDGGNNEFCETCGGVGHFICCDGCPRSFHFACINPPLDIDGLPSTIGDESDTWFCNVCRAAKKPEKGKGRGKRGGMFEPLLRHAEETNPTIFALPPDIRNYFKGVATASDGSYVNSHMLRPIKVNKFGIVDEREPLKLKDKNGKPILCYRCGESAMPADKIAKAYPERPARAAAKAAIAAVTSQTADEDGKSGWRKVVSCDFCSLHWHLDCLTPPLASMPSLSRKWMCPNHVEHVQPSERVPKSVANSTSVHELPLPTRDTIGPGKHYRTRVVNDGQIDIIPDPLDTYVGPSGEDKSSSSSSGEKGWEENTGVMPAYKGYPSVFGSQNNVKIRYRIPEKVFRLDFWTKAELHRERMIEAATRYRGSGEAGSSVLSRSRGLDLLAVVANAVGPTEEEGEKMDDDGAAQEKDGSSAAPSLPSASSLADALFAEQEHPFVKPGEEPVSLVRQSYLSADEEHAPKPRRLIDEEAHPDAANLEAIRQLVAYKGRDALLRFLLE